MYSNNSSSTNAENEKTDSWSFSYEYQRFSIKNKPKSLLGRRTLAQIFPQGNENVRNDESSSNRQLVPERTPLKFQSVNGPSLTHPVNPNVTPVHKFPQPPIDFFTKKELQQDENSGKTCQRGLGFSTPFTLRESRPLKAISCSYEKNKLDDSKPKGDADVGKPVTKELTSVFGNSNVLNKDLNTSFIYEDTFPLPGDNSLSNEADQPIKSSGIDKTTDSSQTENGNNSCFMTAHEIHPPDLNSFRCNELNFKTPRKNQESLYLKTPGRNFTLFSVSQSPIDPLAGILNEDNESFNSDSSLSSPLRKTSEFETKIPTVDLYKSSSFKSTPQSSRDKELDLEDKECLDVPAPTTGKSPHNEIELRSVKADSFAGQCKVIPEGTIGHQKNDSDDKQNLLPIIQENKSSNTELPKKTFVYPPNIEPNKGLRSFTPSSISYTKEPPTVIVNTQRLNQANAVKNNHPLHVPSNNFINSRLIVKPQPQNILFVNNKPYAALSLLGRGGSSEVYQVLEENSSRLLAIKCVNLATVEECTANGYLNEIELLSKLQGCSSVIKMFDHEYVESTKMLYVVMEKGDIDFSKLMKDITKIKKIPMSMIIYYWTEMLSAVRDIHDKGVIHSDLKPGNFLLVCGRLKLIDFGIASSLQGDMTSVEKDVIRGTFNYISPEAISAGENRFHKINYKSDVWSLGCILYNLLFGCTPFSHIISTLGKFQAIADPNLKIRFPKDSSHVPPALKLSLRWCLIKDAKSRPTVDRLLKLSEYAIQLPQNDSSWYECVMKEFPDCSVKLEELRE